MVAVQDEFRMSGWGYQDQAHIRGRLALHKTVSLTQGLKIWINFVAKRFAALCVYLAESVYQVVVRKLIFSQIRQLILFYN